MSCASDSSQRFPETGFPLNLSLNDLRREISVNQEETVYCYIVATIKNNEGRFIQTGSAPNFQGDVISLCTCKHFMRSFRTVDSWPGTWIAGFTGRRAGKEKNALIYLMKINNAFESHCDLWFSKELSMSTKEAKLAHKNKYGDIFQPLNGQIAANDKFDFRQYNEPVSDHSHAPKNGWHKDINYVKGVNGRKPPLLTGDKRNSFLWNKPILFHSGMLSRGQEKKDIHTLLDLLQDKDES